MKFGIYPWSGASNQWTPSVPTKSLLFRTPTYVHDDAGVYTEPDLRAHVSAL